LSKRIVDAPLEILGDRVLEAVCFGVNSVERDLERPDEVELEQAMVSSDLTRIASFPTSRARRVPQVGSEARRS
jgi:hypothetical protein